MDAGDAIFNLSILAVLILIPCCIPRPCADGTDGAADRAAAAAATPPPPPPQQKVAEVKIVSEIDSACTPDQDSKRDQDAEGRSGSVGGYRSQGMQGMGNGTGGGVQGGLFASLNNSAQVVRGWLRSRRLGGPRLQRNNRRYGDFKTGSSIPIAKAAHVQGAVILHAIISKQGTIENLVIVSGPPMLANAARDAVMRWRYKPYLLNGEPSKWRQALRSTLPSAEVSRMQFSQISLRSSLFGNENLSLRVLVVVDRFCSTEFHVRCSVRVF